MVSQRGTATEALFVAEALKRGFHPHHTTGDYLPWDILIVSPDETHTFKVQVRLARHYSPKGQPAPSVQVSAKRRESFDILAAYDPVAEKFFIIPASRITSETAYLIPTHRDCADNWTPML